MNIAIIQVNAPTYQMHQTRTLRSSVKWFKILWTTSLGKMAIVIGFWDAEIGKEVCKTNNTGIHGLGIRNERGDKLEESCVTNNLVIGNTMF